MSRRRLHPVWPPVFLAIGIIVLVAVGVFIASPLDTVQSAIAIGIASSLLASVFYAFADAVIRGGRLRELDDQLERVCELSRSLGLVAAAEEHCITGVKPKSDYSVEEWLGLLRESKSSLTMVGHALDKWCEGEIENEFRASIRRVVANGGKVRLLMLADSAERVASQRDKGYATRIEKTKRVLETVNGQLEGSGSLAAYQLGDGVDMHYMAVCNETSIVTAAYPAKAQSSAKMPALRLSVEGEIAKQLLLDIDALFESSATEIEL